MEKLAREIVLRWNKLKEKCGFYNPKYYPGYPELTEEWCNSQPLTGNLMLRHCSMNSCPILKRARGERRW